MFGVPSSSHMRSSSARWSAASRPTAACASSPFTFATACCTPLPPYASPPSRSSTASCTPVEAPDGTAARPSAPARASHVDLDGRVSARVEDLPARRPARCGSFATPSRGRSTDPDRRAGASSSRGRPRPRASGRARPGRRIACVARRSSSSGSTFSRRATLTAAKSRSPSSSAWRASGGSSGAGSPARPARRGARAARRRDRRARRRRPGTRTRRPPRAAAPSARTATRAGSRARGGRRPRALPARA